MRVTSVYVPNGRDPQDPHYAYKLEWLAALRQFLETELAAEERLLADARRALADRDRVFQAVRLLPLGPCRDRRRRWSTEADGCAARAGAIIRQ